MMGPALSQKTNKMWIMFVDLVLQTNNTAPVLHGFCKTFNNFSTNLLRDMFEPNPVISGSVSWSCPCIPCNSFQSFVQTFLRMVFVAWVGLFVFCVGVPCSMPASVVGGFVVHASWLALYIYIYILFYLSNQRNLGTSTFCASKLCSAANVFSRPMVFIVCFSTVAKQAKCVFSASVLNQH